MFNVECLTDLDHVLMLMITGQASDATDDQERGEVTDRLRSAFGLNAVQTLFGILESTQGNPNNP